MVTEAQEKKKKTGPGVVFSVIFFGRGCYCYLSVSKKVCKKVCLATPKVTLQSRQLFVRFSLSTQFWDVVFSSKIRTGAMHGRAVWALRRLIEIVKNPLKLYEPKTASFRLASTWRRSGPFGALGPWYECGQVWLVYVWYILKEYFTVCANLPSCTTLHSTSR